MLTILLECIIENAVGSGSADEIRGNSGKNTINGKAGNDEINGDAGNDKLYGAGGMILFTEKVVMTI